MICPATRRNAAGSQWQSDWTTREKGCYRVLCLQLNPALPATEYEESRKNTKQG